ncbi:hypothetical protein [Reyranella sp.]|uniref:hypothetical protein n=1 Tax=Reyranella sp. TaxID=1929291 RepID=UPI003BAA7EDD
MKFREAIERDLEDLLDLAERVRRATGISPLTENLRTVIAGLGNDHLAQERRLEEAAFDLRRAWLTLAHRPADRSLKTPRQGDVAHVPAGPGIAFGYERDLDASVLEARGPGYAPTPAGWSGETVLFRSGQASLAAILQFAASRWGHRRALTVAHAGAYFETAALLQAWPSRLMRRAAEDAADTDIVIAEPVSCDGGFGLCRRLPRARRLLVLDLTLSGPAHDPTPYLPAVAEGGIVIAYRSGLKLDQAGLELANVGIVRVAARARTGAAGEAADSLRTLRGLMGSGLTLDEVAALSAPWFMDRAYAVRYAGSVFAANRRLAAAIGAQSRVFAADSHPSLLDRPANAPFCALRLREDGPASRYRRLEAILKRECARRGLLATPGGSFGFRGHRFEAIEPELGPPFLRLAMGWREGHSRSGLTELVAEMAAHPSFDALDRAYAR